MANGVTFSIKGLATLQAKFGRMTPHVIEGLKTGINKATAVVERDAKNVVPVDTGTLRNSIHARPAKHDEKEVFMGASIRTRLMQCLWSSVQGLEAMDHIHMIRN